MSHPTKRLNEANVSADSILEYIIPVKRCRYYDYTKLLPDEILIYVFTYFDEKELYTILRRVCRRWYFLTASPTLWKKISAPEEVPLKILCSWLEQSPLLTELELTGRNDVNVIARKVSKFCKNLQSLKIVNSHGTKSSELLESRTLCRMLKNCKYLTNLYFSGVKILSCKFFQIMSRRKPLGAKKCSYFGPVSQKQMKALIESIVTSDNYDAAALVTSGNKKISIKEISSGGEEVPNIDSIWNDIMNHFDESFDEADEDYFPEENIDM